MKERPASLSRLEANYFQHVLGGCAQGCDYSAFIGRENEQMFFLYFSSTSCGDLSGNLGHAPSTVGFTPDEIDPISQLRRHE